MCGKAKTEKDGKFTAMKKIKRKRGTGIPYDRNHGQKEQDNVAQKHHQEPRG